MQVQAVVPNRRKTKGQKIKTISKLERRRTEYRRKDRIERQIKMTVAVTVTRVEKGNQFLNEEVRHRERTEAGLRTEIDREIDRGIDREIGLGIDLEIEIEGEYKYSYILYNVHTQIFITIV